MKTLFFIISTLGLVYLLVSSINMDRFSFGPEQTVIQSKQSASMDSGLGNEELNKVIQDIEALSLSQRTLQKEVAEVSMVNTQLKEILQVLDQKMTVTPVSGSLEVSPQVKMEATPALMNTSQQADVLDASQGPLLITQTAASQTDSQKRVRQQAILRDLAQKRQFAAINALQKPSGN